jgi:polar amino acid transport system substrate-binding protein
MPRLPLYSRRALLAGLGAGALPARAAEALQAVAGDGTTPFNYLVDGELRGLGVDVVRELAQRAGLSLQLAVMPFRQAFARALSTPNVLLLTVARTPEREGRFEWVGPLAPRDVWLWKLKRRTDLRLTALGDAKQYRVGVVFGDASIADLEQAGLEHKRSLHVIHDRRALGRMLRMDRFDLIPMALWSDGLLSAEGELPEEPLEPVVRLTREGGYYFALAKGSDPALLQRLREAFAQLRADGTLARLRRQWIPTLKPARAPEAP